MGQLEVNFGNSFAKSTASAPTGISKTLRPKEVIGRMSFTIKATTRGIFLARFLLIWSHEYVISPSRRRNNAICWAGCGDDDDDDG